MNPPNGKGNVPIDEAVKRLKNGEFALPDGYKPSRHHGHSTSFTTTRKAEHRGRKISVRTTYRIEIDGEPLTLHTMVLNDGNVHCHGLPNYSFPSAIDLAKAIIDSQGLAYVERDEIGKPVSSSDQNGHGDHGGHH